MTDIEIEKEINRLKDDKMDKVIIENVSTEDLSGLDLTSETDAVKEAIAVLIDLVAKLKSK